MWFGLFYCTANSCWSSVLFAISEAKDLLYSAILVSVGFNPYPISFLYYFASDLAHLQRLLCQQIYSSINLQILELVHIGMIVKVLVYIINSNCIVFWHLVPSHFQSNGLLGVWFASFQHHTISKSPHTSYFVHPYAFTFPRPSYCRLDRTSLKITYLHLHTTHLFSPLYRPNFPSSPYRHTYLLSILRCQ